MEVVDPVEVPLLHLLRVDLDLAVADRVTGGLGERGDLDPPLEGEARLDGGLAARAVADGVDVRPLLGDDPALGAQGGDDGGACLEAVQALEGAGDGDDRALVQDGDERQVVTVADLEVVRVVRGVTLTAPVPNSGSTWWSATTGIVRSVSGSLICLPIRCW
ncbi:hypothetical protein Smic_24190 [Streptomyces microflavus]|uniref:Uncharacterized protein n=1 Tax=Streptomyces microflavus TaxID=1919 RepID=A0A7J0CMZ1_STRMI|nr:hypothetical protein Smic_24190 [Streptomyces microflavus]